MYRPQFWQNAGNITSHDCGMRNIISRSRNSWRKKTRGWREEDKEEEGDDDEEEEDDGEEEEKDDYDYEEEKDEDIEKKMVIRFAAIKSFILYGEIVPIALTLWET